jgi:glycosyltransferase involved in cell wall biosynthesis
MTKLSIITVCLNNANGLAKTIESVLGQVFTDFEFIIIDGGSTDGTIDKIKEYNSNIDYWISEKDNGIYHAMNKGIKQAHSEYCLFLNSGDCIASENTLSEIFKRENGSDFVYGNLIRKKGENRYRITKYPPTLSAYHFYANIISIHHQATLIKTRLFSQYGFYREDFKIVSDREFFFRTIILNNCSTQFLNINFSIFDSTGISSNNIGELDSLMDIFEKSIPPRVVADIKELTNVKKSLKTSFLNRLLKYPIIHNALRFLYLPIIKIIEKINYRNTSKQ